VASNPASDPRFRRFDDFSGDTWVAPADDLRKLDARNLIDFRRLVGLRRDEALSLLFADVDPDYLDADETATDASHLLITPGTVRLRAVCPVEADSYDDHGVKDWIWKAAAGLARRRNLELLEGVSE
jgi:hypothetical protein